MPNTAPTQFTDIIYPTQSKPHSEGTILRDVRQDKGAPKRERIATNPPAPQKYMMRARRMETNPSRSQNHSKEGKKRSTKRKTVHVTLWMKPEMKAELQHLAGKDGLSVSKFGGTLLEEAIHQELHIQHATLIQPIIESAIRKQMRILVTRLTWLMVRIAYDGGQTRTLVTNILDTILGSDQTKISHILAGSSETAKRNITKQTPQIKTLIEEVEKWVREEDENPHA